MPADSDPSNPRQLHAPSINLEAVAELFEAERMPAVATSCGIGGASHDAPPSAEPCAPVSEYTAPRSVKAIRSTGVIELSFPPTPMMAQPSLSCIGVLPVHRHRLFRSLPHVSALSGQSYDLSGRFPCAFRPPAFASWGILSPLAHRPLSRETYWYPRRQRDYHVPHIQPDAVGSVYPPVAHHLRGVTIQHPSLATYHFGPGLSASLARAFLTRVQMTVHFR